MEFFAYMSVIGYARRVAQEESFLFWVSHPTRNPTCPAVSPRESVSNSGLFHNSYLQYNALDLLQYLQIIGIIYTQSDCVRFF